MKIYIAGPFFNEKEVTYLKDMIFHVKKSYPTASLFIPMEHKIDNDWALDNDKWSKAVFDMDVKALDEADMVFALYLGHYSDTGTAWEIGYAYAKNIPINLYIPEDLVGKEDMSIMPMNSGVVYGHNNIEFNQK